MKSPPDRDLDLSILVTEPNLIRFGLLSIEQRMSNLELTKYRQSKKSRELASRHINYIEGLAKKVFHRRLAEERLVNAQTIEEA